MQTEEDQTDEDLAVRDMYVAAEDLALRCRVLRDMNVLASARALESAVNHLMTELWDQGFSQTEIRTVYMAALADMNRYAAGEERR